MSSSRQEPNTGKSFLSSKLVLIVGLAVLVLIVAGVFRQFLRKVQVDSEIQAIQQEVTGLEKRNKELSDLIEYFDTENFQEKEVRTKLNLQKPGEKVVVVPEGDLPDSPAPEVKTIAEQAEEKEPSKSNPRKWWDYFFATKNREESES